MSDLAKLTAAPNATELPGYILSPFRLADLGELESEFERQHVATATAAAKDLPGDVRQQVITAAVKTIADGLYAWGSPAFDRKCLSASALPAMLWVALKAKHPLMTKAEAAKLITPENQYDLQKAVLELAGFSFDTKKAPAPAPDPALTGASSADSSESAGSPGTTSAV